MLGVDFRQLADGSNLDSLSNRLRDRRFARFEQMASRLPRPLRIIDIGGTNQFWENRGWAGRSDVHVVLVNLQDQPQHHRNIEPLVGDATDLGALPGMSFDLAFSNSVIEHLQTFEAQKAMAREVRRLSRSYWIQTPNFWFPIEPHFLFPGWQWLPTGMRVAMIRRRRVGWRGPIPDAIAAGRAVSEIRLLRRRELRALFPDAALVPERFCGLVKSWIAVHGMR